MHGDPSATIPLKDLVLVGGGHAHVHVIKMLRMQGDIPHLRITLISRDTMSPYSGMIPGYICGYYTKDECHIDLLKLASFAKIRFIHAEVNRIDTNDKLIYFTDRHRPPIRYDLMSIDIGISPSMTVEVKKKKEEGESTVDASSAAADPVGITPVKPIDQFADRWERVVQKISGICDQLVAMKESDDDDSSQTKSPNKPLEIAIVGGGGGGVELAFSMDYRLKEIVKGKGLEKHMIRVSVYNRGEEVMTSHAP